MKMLASDFERLKEGVEGVLSLYPTARERYAARQFPRAEITNDVNQRFRWDVAHQLFRKDRRLVEHLYTYLNDTHIDTALRAIVPDVV